MVLRSLACVALVSAVLMVGACAGGGTSRSSTTGTTRPIAPPPGFDRLSAAVTAAALSDRARVDIGVWSMLSHLGVGVYSVAGRQVLAGSESNPRDFWISDTAVPVLERMALAPKIPFSRYIGYLHAHGAAQAEAEVLAAHAAAYAQQTGAFLVQLFNALHVQFNGDPAISPLVEWLLLLDTVVAPNGGVKVARFEQASCSLRGDGRPPGWGIAAGRLPAIRAAFGGSGPIATQALLIANAAEIDVYADPGEVHEGHSGPGALETIRVNARLGVAPYPAGCGGDGVSAINGATALANLVLDWEIDPGDALQHGSFVFNSPTDGVPQPKSKGNIAKSVTSSEGASKVAFQTIEEPSHGKGKLHNLPVRVIVSADVRSALASQGVDPTLLNYMPAEPTVSLARFAISWHANEQTWTGTMTSASKQTVNAQNGGLVCSANWTTAVSLSVDENGHIAGTADTTLDGAPICAHPVIYTQVQSIHFRATGTATDRQLEFHFSASTYEPAGSIDATGLSAGILGFNETPATFTVPIAGPGRAGSSQPLKLVSGSGEYSSQNVISLSCSDC
jgi:hypothetical protein